MNIFEPLVSIIIPTYNRAHLIGETLDSILAQTHTNWECIIVDDGSTDNTDALVSEYIAKDSRFQYHKRPSTRLPGGNAARNYGFEISNGVFIQWFDSDDLMHPELIKTCVSKIHNTEFDYVITNFNLLDLKGEIHKNKRFSAIENIYTNFLSQKIALNTLTFFYSRSALIGFEYDETLKNAQDLDFISRFLKGNHNGTINNEHLFTVRLHETTITSKYQNSEKEAIVTELMVRKKNVHYAQQNFQKEDVAFIRQKLLLKSLKLGGIDKLAFFKLILNFQREKILSFSGTLKILFWSTIFLFSGRGKENYKKVARNG